MNREGGKVVAPAAPHGDQVIEVLRDIVQRKRREVAELLAKQQDRVEDPDRPADPQWADASGSNNSANRTQTSSADPNAEISRSKRTHSAHSIRPERDAHVHSHASLPLNQTLQWRNIADEWQDHSVEIQTQVRQSAAQGEQAVTVISNGQVSTEEDICHTQITHIYFCFLSGLRNGLCRDDTN